MLDRTALAKGKPRYGWDAPPIMLGMLEAAKRLDRGGRAVGIDI